MDLAAAHAGYVYAAYGLSTLVLMGLLARTLLRSRTLALALAERNLADPGRG